MGPFVLTVILFFAAIGIAIAIAMYFQVRRKVARSQLQKVFLGYNETHDLEVLVQWVESDLAHERRVLEVIEYLEIIGEEALAAQFLAKVPSLKQRASRMVALRLYRKLPETERALDLARQLHRDHPNDDAVLDAYLGTLLDAGYHDEVRPIIQRRLHLKTRGTVFSGHAAHLLALDGQIEAALKIWYDIEKRERTLFENTLAQPIKSEMERQLRRTQSLIEQFEAQITP